MPPEQALNRERSTVTLLRRTGLVVTAEDHSIIAGLGGAVAEVLAERCPTLMRRVGLRDCFGESGPDEQLLETYGLSARRMADVVTEALRART